VPQTRFTIAPSATFCPASVATADASTRCVESGMSVMIRVTGVLPVIGTVSWNPSGNTDVSATVSVVVFV
jgi:hypothetical protein